MAVPGGSQKAGQLLTLVRSGLGEIGALCRGGIGRGDETGHCEGFLLMLLTFRTTIWASFFSVIIDSDSENGNSARTSNVQSRMELGNVRDIKPSRYTQ